MRCLIRMLIVTLFISSRIARLLLQQFLTSYSLSNIGDHKDISSTCSKQGSTSILSKKTPRPILLIADKSVARQENGPLQSKARCHLSPFLVEARIRQHHVMSALGSTYCCPSAKVKISPHSSLSKASHSQRCATKHMCPSPLPSTNDNNVDSINVNLLMCCSALSLLTAQSWTDTPR